MEEQTCNFNIKNNDKIFNTFLSKWIGSSNLKKTAIHFRIEWAQSSSKNSETFDTTVELKSLIENGTNFIGKDRHKKVPILVENKLMEKLPKENQ